MILAQHIVSSLVASGNNAEWMKEHIPYVVFPDAVRAFSRIRPYSHFTMSLDGKDISWWKIPIKVNEMTEQIVQDSLKKNAHLGNYKYNEISNYTDIQTFREHNQHLPKNMFNGIQLHLRQDCMFDLFIKGTIDCSRNEEDIYYYKGKRYGNEEIRNIANEIQKISYYILAERAYRKFGLTCNSRWLEESIFPMLKSAFSKDLYEAVIPYITIDKTIDKWISNHDWSHLDEGIVDRGLVELLHDAIERYSFAGNNRREDLNHILRFVNAMQIYIQQ